MIDPVIQHRNALDAAKLVLGFVTAKGKKRKTKCQQKRKLRELYSPPFARSVRQCSKRKFIVIDKVGGVEIHDHKRNIVTTVR